MCLVLFIEIFSVKYGFVEQTIFKVHTVFIFHRIPGSVQVHCFDYLIFLQVSLFQLLDRDCKLLLRILSFWNSANLKIKKLESFLKQNL